MEKQYLEHFVNFSEELSELCSQNCKKKKTWGKVLLIFYADLSRKKQFCYSRPIREERSYGNSPTTLSVDLFRELDQAFAEGLRFLSRPQRNCNTATQVEKAELACLAETSKVPEHSAALIQEIIFIDDEYSLHFDLLCWPLCHKYITGEKNDFRIGEMFGRRSSVALKFCQVLFFQPSKMNTPANDKTLCYCIISEQIHLIQLFLCRITLLELGWEIYFFYSVPLLVWADFEGK